MYHRLAQGKTVLATFLIVMAGLSSEALASVTLNPGADIQSAINSNSEGTTFILNAGVYRLTTGLIPKSSDVFTGQPGAVLNGARLLTSWSQSGSTWVTQTATQHFPSASLRCTPSSYAGCHYDDAVFYDDQPLWRVMSMGELRPGYVYVDFSTDHVYLADNPQGHKVEMATSSRAFISARTGVVNVTIQGLVVEKCANAGGEGALEAGSTWTILNNEIRLNHGIGLTDGILVRGNFVHHNGELGVGGGSGSNGMLVENNEISYNNRAGFDWYMEGGATKWFNTSNLTLRGNYVHDNNGPGLWTDGDNIHTIYENNHTKNNAGPGIFHEISFDAIIRNNIVEYDSLGAAGSSLWWGAGIFLNSSSEVEIYGNQVSYCLHGIGGSSTDHGSSPLNGRRYSIQNVNVHDNIITLNSGIAAGFVRDSSVVPPDIFTSWNNHFDYNTYYLSDVNGRAFDWNDSDRTRSEWQSYSNDIHGTFLPLGFGTTTTASIANPLNGSVVSGMVAVFASASDTSGITKVEFYVDGALKATNLVYPWNFSWDASSASAGSHTLSVKAYGATGGTATAQVTETVPGAGDTTPPSASITSPVANSTVSGTVTVTVLANDNVGVTSVLFYVDGTLNTTKTAAPWTFSWNAALAATGPHSLSVVAYDAAGNNGGGAITVFVAAAADTVAPTASITSPANNATVSGVVNVTATANDNVGVTRVEFSVDGSLTSTKTAAPWTFSWNAALAATGPHTLSVVAYDAAGNNGGSAITVFVAAPADTVAPTASITSPANNAVVSGVVNVTATANDNVGVTRVEFSVDGSLAATKTTAPWTFSWNAASAATGPHTLAVVAYDAAGNQGGSAITVTIAPTADTTPPTAGITFPFNNSTVSGIVTVTATASDNVGVTRVEFSVDGSLAATKTAAPWTFSWDATKVAGGSHTLQVTAYDAAGNKASSTVTVTVAGLVATGPPTVIIGSPVDNATVSGIVTVSPIIGGTVTQLLLYVDGRLAGTNTSAPWNFTWDTATVTAGQHSLQVLAFDDVGNHDRALVWVNVSH